ncbi:class IV adenylate cyclase [Bythopirellula goksoeyrii]|uniref:CYTH domain protein n=1 Tax=Bythopirellula goksoeyrii TaxID=1400387 RepID=A0A5B9QGK0_9BACT|nr:class IV adenylate cyclase [Bythopirellula goksoeyrii]QEG37039.1 CYTH domain protein [Bythopirellula goksoeyrii]
MPIEVEQKYRVATHAPTVTALGAWDVTLGDAVEQVDTYYRHPQRDFAQTDEAFRLRSVGKQNFMTYKGPKLDAETKTRHEEEVRLADGPEARQTFEAILRHLAFDPVATVTKHRIICNLERDGFHVEIALDQIEELGPFVEIEITIPATRDAERSAAERVDPERVTAAKQVLAALANELGISEVERRSYLELLLEERK